MAAINTPASLVDRIRHTPMRDVICGRFTGRLNIKDHVAQSGLPQSASELIQRVVRRTHLRSLEKVDVADELIAHFADGLESGRTIDQLVESFGDERQAARMVGRAKRRNRSILARTQTIIGRGFAALIVVYVLIGIYYFSGRPSGDLPIEELNRNARQIPKDQLAWPLFEKALAANKAGDKQRATELIREAAAKRVIGYFVRPDLGGVDNAFSTPNGDGFDARSQIFPNADFWSAISWSVELLRSDALQARNDGDARKTLVPDINAMDQLCRQWHADPVMGSDMAMYMFEEEMNQIDQTLVEKRSLLSDENLKHLAAQIAPYRNAADLMNLRPIELQFQIWLDGHFTSGGTNPGRITARGLSLVIGDDNWISNDKLWRSVLQPGLFIVVPSRARVEKEFNAEIESIRPRLNVPYRLANWKPLEEQTNSGNGLFSRLQLRTNVCSAICQDARWAEDQLGHRDGVLVGIALEQYRRAHQKDATSLDQLLPDFLAQVPADRVTGEPVHYRIVNGKPVVYSVGQDRHDDGGKCAVDPYNNHEPEPHAAADADVPGDWLLYPAGNDD